MYRTLEGTSAAKAAKNIAKIQSKEAKHDAAIAAKLTKYASNAAKLAKVQAKEAKHDAKISAKLTKYGGIISAANALPSIAPLPSVPASVLPTVPNPATLVDPAAAFAPSAGGGGGGGMPIPFPDASQAQDQAAAGDESPLSGYLPWILGGGAVLVGGFLLMRKRGRR